MTALLGTFVRMQTMSDGTPRLIIDLQCKLLELAQLGLEPGTPLAIARITNEASMQQEPKQEQPKVSHENSKWLAIRCMEPLFWQFLNKQFPSADTVCGKDGAKDLVYYLLTIESRKELDVDSQAAERMHKLLRRPYSEFVRSQS